MDDRRMVSMQPKWDLKGGKRRVSGFNLDFNLARAQSQMDDLEERLSQLEKVPLAYPRFSANVAFFWRGLKALEELLVRNDCPKENLVSLQMNLEENRQVIMSYVIDQIYFSLNQIEKNGDTTAFHQWLSFLDEIAPQESKPQSFELDYSLARLRFDLNQNYKNAREKYYDLELRLTQDDFASDLEKFQLLDSSLNHLQIHEVEFKKSFQAEIDPSEFSAMYQDLLGWIARVDAALEPLRSAYSRLPTIALNASFSEDLVLIQKARSNGSKVQYYTSDAVRQGVDFVENDPNDIFSDNLMGEIDADQAENICIGRWQEVSAFKYLAYLRQMEQDLGSVDGPYHRDPRRIKTFYENKISGSLLPIGELKNKDIANIQNRYNNFLPILDAAALKVSQIESQLLSTQKSNSDLEALARMRALKTEISDRAPFLEALFREQYNDLVLGIEANISENLSKIDALYQIDLVSAKEEAEALSAKLEPHPEFARYVKRARTIVEKADSLENEIERLSRMDDIEVAYNGLVILYQQAQKVGPVPDDLIRMRDAYRVAKQPLHAYAEIINKMDKEVEPYRQNPEKISFETVFYLSGQIETVINELQAMEVVSHSDRSSAALEELGKRQRQLTDIRHYLKVSNELQKKNADLEKAASWLAPLTGDWLPVGSLEALHQTIAQFSKNDEFIKPELQRIEALLENPENPIFDSLLADHKKVGIFLQSPTSFASRLVKAQREIEKHIYFKLDEIFQPFLKAPRSVANLDRIEDLAFRLNEINSRHVLNNEIGPAVHEARAWQAVKDGDWQAALNHWKNARGRKDAKEHYLAVLKIFALTEALDQRYRPLRMALQTPELESDPQLLSANVKRLLDEFEESFMQFESWGGIEKTPELHGILNLLDRILGRGQSQAHMNFQMSSIHRVWHAFEYELYFDHERTRHVFDPQRLRDYTKRLQILYGELVSIARMVQPENGLRTIQAGVSRAVAINEQSEISVEWTQAETAHFSRQWRVLLEQVRNSLKSAPAVTKTEQSEKVLKTWLLDSQPVSPVDIARAVSIYLNALEDEQLYWTNPETYRQDIGPGGMSCVKHAQALRQLIVKLSDLAVIVTTQENNQALGRFHGEINAILSPLNDFLGQVMQLKAFTEDLSDRLNSAVSLMISVESTNGLSQIQKAWWQYSEQAAEQLSAHPAYQWCQIQIQQILDLRNAAQEILGQIYAVSVLDNHFGLDLPFAREKVQRNELSQLAPNHDAKLFEEVINQFEFARETLTNLNWMNYSLSLIAKLEELDPGNRTNWRENLAFRQIKGVGNIIAWLNQEVDQIQRLLAVRDATNLSAAPGCGEKDFEAHLQRLILSGKYQMAIRDYYGWLGISLEPQSHSSLQDLTIDVPKEGLVVLGRFLPRNVENNPTAVRAFCKKWGGSSNQGQPVQNGFLQWCGERLVLIERVEQELERKNELSGWRRGLGMQLVAYQPRIIEKLNAILEIWPEINEKKEAFFSAYEALQVSESELMQLMASPLRHFRKKEIEQVRGVVKRQLERCREIAPRHAGVLQKLEYYGLIEKESYADSRPV
jgi:hypothetical protein